jgi:hypothetical protein
MVERRVWDAEAAGSSPATPILVSHVGESARADPATRKSLKAAAPRPLPQRSHIEPRAGTEDASLPLLAAARYLAAHATTTRSERQTFEIARRLGRGERLYEDVSVTL